MKTEPNELAFPHHAVWDNDKPEIGWIDGGLTKREYFAAMAMQGFLTIVDKNFNAKELAEPSVKMADALIEALNQQTERKAEGDSK